MRNEWRTMVLAGGVLAVVMWLFHDMAYHAGRGGEGAPLYSVHRFDPYGSAALHRWLVARGTPVRIVEQSRLRPRDTGVLIQILPVQPSPILDMLHVGAPQTMAAAPLRRWIEQGNTVVQFTSDRTPLMTECGLVLSVNDRPIHYPWRGAETEDAMRRGHPPESLFSISGLAARWNADASASAGISAPGVSTLVFHAGLSLPRAATETWTPLASTPDGHVVAGVQRVGEGRLIVIGCPTPALNGFVLKGHNVELIAALIGDAPVLFDAWSQGVGHGGGVMDAIQAAGLTPVLLQVILVLGLYLWSGWGIRRPEVAVPMRRRSIGEQVITLGYLYGQSLSPAQVLHRTRQTMERMFAEAMRTTVPGLSRKLARLGNDRCATEMRNLLAQTPQVATRAAPRCRVCGYILRGVTHENCPECGTPIPPMTRRIIQSMASEPPKEADDVRGRVEYQAVRLLQRARRLTQELERERTGRD